MAGEADGNEGKEKKKVYILTPAGTLGEVTDKADILRSLLKEYKIDSSVIDELIGNEIEDIKRQLEKELQEDE